jgi:hypothetical protein
MSRPGHVAACGVGFISVALGGPALAEAAPLAPITGNLDRAGYTVLALTDTGQASSVVAQSGSFSVEPPAETVTLHLRAPDGTYAGPVVLVPRAIPVQQARAAVAKAARKVKRAERNVTAARRRLNSTPGGPARRRAARLLRRARQQLTKAKRTLSEAQLVLADAKLQATTLKQAEAEVANAEQKVKRAKRNVSVARRRVKRARGGPARRRAAALLRRARRQLAKARRQLVQANQLLAAKRQQPNQAILGVKAGAPLGSVAVNPAAGYAVSRADFRVRTTWVDASRRAQAVNGVPIGAGNFGFVTSRLAGAGVPGDRDTDGVADPLDVDADGDLILNNFERPSTATAAQAGAVQDIASKLMVRLEETANVNAGGLSADGLDATLSRFGVLFIGHSPAGTKELDCGGLVYCSLGGTGVIAYAGPPSLTPANGPPFPACCDSDGDGFGTTTNPFALAHGAPTAKFDGSGTRLPGGIGTGDVLIERVSGGTDATFPMTVQTVFATVPALISYSDGAGHTSEISYPVADPFTGSPPAPDQFREGLPVSAGPGGDVVLTFTFWRPQRLALEGEVGTWTDIGGLLYSAEPTNVRPGRAQCPQSAFLIPEGQPLTPDAIPHGGGALRDSVGDQAVDSQNRLTFSVNVTQCLAAYGLSWEQDQSMEIDLIGTNGFDDGAQRLYFKRQ